MFFPTETHGVGISMLAAAGIVTTALFRLTLMIYQHRSAARAAVTINKRVRP